MNGLSLFMQAQGLVIIFQLVVNSSEVLQENGSLAFLRRLHELQRPLEAFCSSSEVTALREDQPKFVVQLLYKPRKPFENMSTYENRSLLGTALT